VVIVKTLENSLMSCSVHFSVAKFFQPTSETSSLLCLAEVARLPLDGSSYRVFNWCRNQEAVVHRVFSVACVSPLSRTMTITQLK